MAAKKKTRRSVRSLRGTQHEHFRQATYELTRLTPTQIWQTPCADLGQVLFDAGRVIAHASAADDGSPTGRKLFAMAAARRDQAFAKAAGCGCGARRPKG